MIRWIAAIFLGLMAVSAQAQDFPALYDVTGVASDDVLNIRAEPTAGADILETLAHDATGVEILAVSNGWGQVSTDLGSGWTSLSYLVRTGGIMDATGLSCFGTEPFWSLDLMPGSLSSYTSPSDPGTMLLAGPLTKTSGRRGEFGIVAVAPDQSFSATLRYAACSDGMSDRAFGIATQVIRSGQDNRVLSGCCSLQTP